MVKGSDLGINVSLYRFLGLVTVYMPLLLVPVQLQPLQQGQQQAQAVLGYRFIMSWGKTLVFMCLWLKVHQLS